MTDNGLLKKLPSAVFISVLLVFTSVAGHISADAADFTDLPQPGHWSYDGISAVIENGIMEGYGDGTFRPDGIITLAEASAYISRTMKAGERSAEMPGIAGYVAGSWYDEQGVIAIAYQMGVLDGIIAAYGTVTPDTPLTSEDAFDIMARTVMAGGVGLNALDRFTDGGAVSEAYRASIAALAAGGYIEGHLNPDGTKSLVPGEPVTRARFATVFGRMFGQFISKAGEYGQDDIASLNVVVNAQGVTLRDLIIHGDLIIGDGVGDMPLVLDNVQVNGRIVNRSGEDPVDGKTPDPPPDVTVPPPDTALPQFYSSTLYYAFLTDTQLQRNADGSAAAEFLTGDTYSPVLMFNIDRASADGLSVSRFYRLDYEGNDMWSATAVPVSSMRAGYVALAGSKEFALSASPHTEWDDGMVFEYRPNRMPVVSALDESDGGLGFGSFLGYNEDIGLAGDRMAVVILGVNAEDEVFALAAFVFSNLVDRNAAAGIG